MQGCYDAGLIGRIVEGGVDKVSRDWGVERVSTIDLVTLQV